MLTSEYFSKAAPTSEGDDRQLRMVTDIHASVRALLDALKEQDVDEIEQQAHALESQCAVIAAIRHRQLAHRAQPANSEDRRDTMLNAVSEVRGTLQVARMFLAKLRRSNAIMLQVHAVAEGSYSMHEPGANLRQ